MHIILLTSSFLFRIHIRRQLTRCTWQSTTTLSHTLSFRRNFCIGRDDIGDDFDANIYGYHLPVMLQECCDYLAPEAGRIFVDCTLGGGGHTRALLERKGTVIGLDQDPDAITETSTKFRENVEKGTLEIICKNFRYLSDAIRQSVLAKGSPVDGILLDLGVSSFQINNADRGFAFSMDGPLDMRMSKGESQTLLTADVIVNTWDATKLANLFYDFGEEPRSRVIAREIVAARPLNTTSELKDVISKVTYFKHRVKTLARCFQAIRIAVNDELGALDQVLAAAAGCLRPGGRICVISYHSLEDRRVKQFFKTGSSNWHVLTKRSVCFRQRIT